MALPAAYRRAEGADLSPRQIECMAFAHVNRRLDTCETPSSRRRALTDNHRLWSLLMMGLSTENHLPPVLREDLITLGTWMLRYTNSALNRDVDLGKIRAINQDMIEALSA